MQTFLPYSSFVESARVLDNKRLGKQRVEAWQIYQSLTIPEYGWKNHPIVKMWKGYEVSLLLYGRIVCLEWRKRGFKDSMLERFENELKKLGWIRIFKPRPYWIGDSEFHDSHKSNLLRKNYDHYKQYNWNVPATLEYKWIINEDLK